jgi:hypothetical protein
MKLNCMHWVWARWLNICTALHEHCAVLHDTLLCWYREESIWDLRQFLPSHGACPSRRMFGRCSWWSTLIHISEGILEEKHRKELWLSILQVSNSSCPETGRPVFSSEL